MIKKKIMFSAIQPTGIPTIAHYVSIFVQWINMQYKYDCFFCIADLHAMTNLNNLYNIKKYVLDILSILLSIGINPDNSTIFLQSDIIEHLKLFWILSSFSKYGDIKRMHKFKCSNNNSNINTLLYPILMASDILLYKTDIVSIGKDQKQHLELVCNISKYFNNFYNKKLFLIPKILYSNNCNYILSLLDLNKKMSKSDLNINNFISILENKDSLFKKISGAKTDSDSPPLIKYDIFNKPGISNLLSIVSCINNIPIRNIENSFKNKNYSNFKKYVYLSILNKLNNIQKKYYSIIKNTEYLKNILYNGKMKAKFIAEKNISNIENIIFNKD